MGATSQSSSRNAVTDGEEGDTHFHSNASQDGFDGNDESEDVEGEVWSSKMCTTLLPLRRRWMPPLAPSRQRWPTTTTPATSSGTSAEAATDGIANTANGCDMSRRRHTYPCPTPNLRRLLCSPSTAEDAHPSLSILYAHRLVRTGAHKRFFGHLLLLVMHSFLSLQQRAWTLRVGCCSSRGLRAHCPSLPPSPPLPLSRHRAVKDAIMLFMLGFV